jgi:hypothetical protein
MPDLLRVETLGGWVGYDTSYYSSKRLFYFSMLLGSTVFYYFDLCLDIIVLVNFFDSNDHNFAVMVLFAMFLGISISCVLDKNSTESTGISYNALSVDGLRIRALPLWVRCMLNTTHLRMAYEFYMGYEAWKRGNRPPVGFDQIRAAEGLFESGADSTSLFFSVGCSHLRVHSAPVCDPSLRAGPPPAPTPSFPC